MAANSTFSKFDNQKAAESSSEEVEAEMIAQKVLHLPLPAHFNHLMKLFEQFEMSFSLLRHRHDEWTITFD